MKYFIYCLIAFCLGGLIWFTQSDAAVIFSNKIVAPVGTYQVFYYSQDKPETLGIVDTTTGKTWIYNVEDNNYREINGGMISGKWGVSPSVGIGGKIVRPDDPKPDVKPHPKEPTLAGEKSILKKKG